MEKLREIQKRLKKNKGFSLVELIIVIAIMAILVAILAPQFLKYVERSRNSADVANAREMTNAIIAYGADPEEGGDVVGVTLKVTKDGCEIKDNTGSNTGNVIKALYEAGVTATKDGTSGTTLTDIKCKSTRNWTDYSIKVTKNNPSSTSDNSIRFEYSSTGGSGKDKFAESFQQTGSTGGSGTS